MLAERFKCLAEAKVRAVLGLRIAYTAARIERVVSDSTYISGVVA